MWTYRQTTGLIVDDTGDVLQSGRGYSGAAADKDNPADQAVNNQGPIPQGKYSIGAPTDTPAHGPYVLPLTPDPANEMFGRSGFLIHGDSIQHPGCASQGCVILPRSVRENIWASDDHELTVIA